MRETVNWPDPNKVVPPIPRFSSFAFTVPSAVASKFTLFELWPKKRSVKLVSWLTWMPCATPVSVYYITLDKFAEIRHKSQELNEQVAAIEQAGGTVVYDNPRFARNEWRSNPTLRRWLPRDQKVALNRSQAAEARY